MPELFIANNKQRGFTLLELVVIIIIISILGLLALDRVWALRIAAEQASVTKIIGNIRSALGLEVARLAIAGKMSQVAKLANSNPIPLLSQPPIGYIGEINRDISQRPPGSWYFDLNNNALVYHVRYAENFTSTLTGLPRIRHRIKLIYRDTNHNDQYDVNIDSIGGLDLIPVEPFSWKINTRRTVKKTHPAGMTDE